MFQDKILDKYKFLLKSNCQICKNLDELCQNCFNKLLNAQRYINSGIPLKYIDLPLDVFNKNVNENNKTVSETIIKKRNDVYNNVVNYINNIQFNINSGKGILFYGSFGTGKSTLSMNIAKIACDINFKCKVREFSEIVKISQTGTEIDSEQSCDILNEITNCDLYCIENIDYVYAKKESDFVKMLFDNIISLANKYSISLIITTNMKPIEMNKRFNEHVYSVLHEICNVYEVPGLDVRLNSKK